MNKIIVILTNEVHWCVHQMARKGTWCTCLQQFRPLFKGPTGRTPSRCKWLLSHYLCFISSYNIRRLLRKLNENEVFMKTLIPPCFEINVKKKIAWMTSTNGGKYLYLATTNLRPNLITFLSCLVDRGHPWMWGSLGNHWGCCLSFVTMANEGFPRQWRVDHGTTTLQFNFKQCQNGGRGSFRAFKKSFLMSSQKKWYHIEILACENCCMLCSS